MKKQMLFLILPMLLFASVGFAGYEEMKKALENYTPQDSFPLRTLSETPGPDSGSPAAELLIDHTFPDTLKQGYEQEIVRSHGVAEAMGVDEDILARLLPAKDDRAVLAAVVGQKIDLKEIKAIAALRNTDIKAAQKKVLAEIQSFDQVTHLDDTLRQYAAFTAALDNRIGPLKAANAVRAGHPFPGLAALKGRVVQSQVNMLDAQMLTKAKQVRNDLEKAYWDLVFTTRSIRIIHETTAAFDRLLGVAASLYQSGRTSYQDVIKVTIKIEALKEDRVSLENDAASIEARLLELMNLPADTRTGPVKTASLPQTIPESGALAAMARDHRQELAALRFQISKVQSMLEMSESMKEARFTLGLSYWDADHVNTAGTGAPKQAFAEKTMASMKNNLPQSPWYGVDGPWVQQTRQTLAGLEHTLTARENETDRMVVNAWVKTDKLLRELDLYQNRILPLTKSALDVSTREYETGAIAFSQAIGSYTDWLAVMLAIAQKTKDLGIAFADLETIVGRPLEHTHRK
jgi:hypothetical protein